MHDVYRKDDILEAVDSKKFFKQYFKILTNKKYNLRGRINNRLTPRESAHLTHFLSQRECPHSYTKDKVPRAKDAERLKRSKSLISKLCYNTSKSDVAEFLRDPVLNLSLQAVSNEIIEIFVGSSDFQKTLGPMKTFANLAVRYAEKYNLPIF